jgi:hypothetical protein
VNNIREEILRNIPIMARRCGVYNEDIIKEIKDLVDEKIF